MHLILIRTWSNRGKKSMENSLQNDEDDQQSEERLNKQMNICKRQKFEGIFKEMSILDAQNKMVERLFSEEDQ